MEKIFHTPEGVRDIYGRECAQKYELKTRMRGVFQGYGYEEIETPTFEYFEVFSREVGTVSSRDLYKFFDREGNTLVLRPDFTPSVSRACASYFAPEEDAVRLFYTGQAFLNSTSYQGRLKEVTQMGVERVGDDSPEADAELLAMTVECLLASGLREFQVSVGLSDYFRSLLSEAGLEEEDQETLRSLISDKNYFGVEEFVAEKGLSPDLAAAFAGLPNLFGSREVLDQARKLTGNQEAVQAVDRLEKIHEILKLYGYEKYISFDFGMISKIQYYTGVIFQAYSYGIGEPLVKGGRYNELLKHFGRPAPSIGFVIVVDSLLLALTRQDLGDFREEVPYRLTYTEETFPEAVVKAQRLRREGRQVALCKVKEDC